MKPLAASRLELYGIIGHPLTHSLSPVMQQAALDHMRRPAVYLPFEITPRQLGRGIRALRRLGVRGFNVTVPHKEAMVSRLDQVDAIAKRLGAVNTVVRRGQRLIGYNTDAAALVRVLPTSRQLYRREALVLGAGGAARAVLWALQRQRVGRVVMTNRTYTRAMRLQRWSRRVFPRLQVDCIRWAQRDRWLTQHAPAVIVNATSLGLRVRDPLPVSLRAVRQPTMVCDLTYRAPRTTWVARARARRLLARDGRDMLLYQGAQAFTLWTKRPAPLAVMRRALQRALRKR